MQIQYYNYVFLFSSLNYSFQFYTASNLAGDLFFLCLTEVNDKLRLRYKKSKTKNSILLYLIKIVDYEHKWIHILFGICTILNLILIYIPYFNQYVTIHLVECYRFKQYGVIPFIAFILYIFTDTIERNYCIKGIVSKYVKSNSKFDKYMKKYYNNSALRTKTKETLDQISTELNEEQKLLANEISVCTKITSLTTCTTQCLDTKDCELSEEDNPEEDNPEEDSKIEAMVDKLFSEKYKGIRKQILGEDNFIHFVRIFGIESVPPILLILYQIFIQKYCYFNIFSKKYQFILNPANLLRANLLIKTLGTIVLLLDAKNPIIAITDIIKDNGEIYRFMEDRFSIIKKF